MAQYDFSGYATRFNVKCSDGRTITNEAFKDQDGVTVPIVWNHKHESQNNVLGHALLEYRDDGMYTYGSFNDTEPGRVAKQLVEHGDIKALSIYANRLKQRAGDVIHGAIREVSLVLAGANPEAFIDSIIVHGEESNEEAIIYFNDDIELSHAEEDKEDLKVAEPEKKEDTKEKTVGEVFNTLTDEQKTVVYAMIGQALEGVDDKEDDKEDDKADDKAEHSNINENEEDNIMKHNVFDTEDKNSGAVLTHSDQEAILNLAKTNSCGSLRDAIGIYTEQNESLQHGIDEIETLFPDYKDVRPGAPEFIQRDQGWVTNVMQKVHKSPISRIRTRQADITGNDLRANGYQKGHYKNVPGNIKLLKRTTDPQTVYRKDALHRDDIIDITDFDVVEYQYQVMKQNLNEELATAIMIGDGRDEGDEYKIDESHIRSIWHDDDLYTIHRDVDIDATREEIQGTDTAAHFGDNYIYAEAIISAALYAREKYKGSGNLDFYCTPHLLNVMLLARDMNGRRIYDSKADLAAALNVGVIHTAEQFEDKTRTVTVDGSVLTKKLLGIFVNLSDYQVGSTKGGEITRFNQFDIDFNQEKYLIEARLSGALTRVKSAIVLEEDVTGD